MAATLVATGELMNTWGRMVAALTVSPAFDSNHPATRLYDDEPGSVGRFGSISADQTITADHNLVTNGDMVGNSGGNLTTWVESNTGTGDVTYDATGGKSGGAGMKLNNPAASTSSAYQDIRVRAGERLVITAELKGGGANAVRLRIQNLQTGNYLTGALAWQAAATDVFTETGAAFATKGPSAFTVESSPTYRPDLQVMTLRITILNDTASTTMFADDIYLWPSTDLVAVCWHNIDPRISLELRRDSAAFAGAGTLEATITSFPLSFYQLTGAMRDDRYWRLKFVGTNSAQLYAAEVIFTQKLALSRIFNEGETIEHEWPTQRTGSRSYRQRDKPTRSYDLTFDYDNETEFEQARDALWLRSGNGHWNALLIPIDSGPTVAYGKLVPDGGTWEVRRKLMGFYEDSPFRFEELPGPSFVR